jgi:hypothetical protein
MPTFAWPIRGRGSPRSSFRACSSASVRPTHPRAGLANPPTALSALDLSFTRTHPAGSEAGVRHPGSGEVSPGPERKRAATAFSFSGLIGFSSTRRIQPLKPSCTSRHRTVMLERQAGRGHARESDGPLSELDTVHHGHHEVTKHRIRVIPKQLREGVRTVYGHQHPRPEPSNRNAVDHERRDYRRLAPSASRIKTPRKAPMTG